MDKFDQDVVQQKLRELDATESANWADYKAFKSNGDAEAAANAAEAAFATQDRREAFIRRCNEAVAQPQQPYVSDEARAARTVPEMDLTDHTRMWNESRYAKLGRAFTPQDVQREFQKLPAYKTLRGLETK